MNVLKGIGPILAGIITALPCVWLGGLLHRAKQAER
jgi:hypothetical protein